MAIPEKYHIILGLGRSLETDEDSLDEAADETVDEIITHDILDVTANEGADETEDEAADETTGGEIKDADETEDEAAGEATGEAADETMYGEVLSEAADETPPALTNEQRIEQELSDQLFAESVKKQEVKNRTEWKRREYNQGVEDLPSQMVISLRSDTIVLPVKSMAKRRRTHRYRCEPRPGGLPVSLVPWRN